MIYENQPLQYDRSLNIISPITETSHPIAYDPQFKGYAYPWVLYNMPDPTQPTRILISAENMCEPTSGELSKDKMSHYHSCAAGGAFLWTTGLKFICGVDADEAYPNILAVPDEASMFLYDCLKWWEEREKLGPSGIHSEGDSMKEVRSICQKLDALDVMKREFNINREQGFYSPGIQKIMEEEYQNGRVYWETKLRVLLKGE